MYIGINMTKFEFLDFIFQHSNRKYVFYLDDEPNRKGENNKNFYSILAIGRSFDMDIEVDIGELYTTQEEADNFNLKENQAKEGWQLQFIKDNLIK